MGQMMICAPCMSNYYLCDFKKNIDKKLDKSDGADDDIYILYVR
jgi:hypothetical protein